MTSSAIDRMIVLLSIPVLLILGWILRRGVARFETAMANMLERGADKFKKKPDFGFICPHCPGPVTLTFMQRIYGSRGLLYKCSSCHREMAYLYDLGELVGLEDRPKDKLTTTASSRDRS